MLERIETRRSVLSLAAAGSVMVLAASTQGSAIAAEGKKEMEVGAVEDLMREHGILRRALLVYGAAETKLRSGRTPVDPSILNRTAKLFRAFGEDYHERQLEEAYIFPAIKRVGGPAAAYPDVLLAQHNRGREITDYILAVTGKGQLGNAEFAPLLEKFVLMYEHHAAREDTVVFPAWKETLSKKQLHELGEKFEDIEHQQFGEDGFEDAVKQITDIEQAFGLSDIAQFTAPPPPKI